MVTTTLLLFACAGLNPQQPKAPADELAVRVGHIEIMRSEVLAEVNRMIPLTYYHGTVPTKKMRAFHKQAVDEVIEKTLVALDALERRIEVTPKEIETRLFDAVKKSGGNPASLDAKAKSKLLAKYRSQVTRRILIDKNVTRFTESLQPTTDAAIHSHYLTNGDSYRAPAQARLSHILIKVPPAAPDQDVKAAEKNIELARVRIVSGTPFEEVAKSISEDIYATKGGDLGWVKRGSMLHGPVEKVAFELDKGGVSPVIDSIYGFHLVQCRDKRDGEPLTEKQATPAIRVHLTELTRRTARQRWISGLRQKHGVKIVGAYEIQLFAEAAKAAADLHKTPRSKSHPPRKL